MSLFCNRQINMFCLSKNKNSFEEIPNYIFNETKNLIKNIENECNQIKRESIINEYKIKENMDSFFQRIQDSQQKLIDEMNTIRNQQIILEKKFDQMIELNASLTQKSNNLHESLSSLSNITNDLKEQVHEMIEIHSSLLELSQPLLEIQPIGNMIIHDNNQKQEVEEVQEVETQEVETQEVKIQENDKKIKEVKKKRNYNRKK